MVAVGERAPEFQAPDQDGKPFKLSSLKGSPVVLYFYPQADTPGCTIEAKGFRDHMDEFRAKGVHVVGVSTDGCADQKEFAKKYGLNFTLIADDAKDVAKAYGVLGPAGRARRVSFFIGPDGTVADVVENVPADKHVERARTKFLN
jgi:thioredoxin-dependent peroxiredoxin